MTRFSTEPATRTDWKNGARRLAQRNQRGQQFLEEMRNLERKYETSLRHTISGAVSVNKKVSVCLVYVYMCLHVSTRLWIERFLKKKSKPKPRLGSERGSRSPFIPPEALRIHQACIQTILGTEILRLFVGQENKQINTWQEKKFEDKPFQQQKYERKYTTYTVCEYIRDMHPYINRCVYLRA